MRFPVPIQIQGSIKRHHKISDMFLAIAGLKEPIGKGRKPGRGIKLGFLEENSSHCRVRDSERKEVKRQ